MCIGWSPTTAVIMYAPGQFLFVQFIVRYSIIFFSRFALGALSFSQPLFYMRPDNLYFYNLFVGQLMQFSPIWSHSALGMQINRKRQQGIDYEKVKDIIT